MERHWPRIVPDMDKAGIPTELPPRQQTAAAWLGPEMAARSDWIETLDAAELAELEAASGSICARGMDLALLQHEMAQLPLLQPRLQSILADVLEGRGFVLLRGLPVQRWGLAQSAAAFMLLGTHFGNMRPQNANGHVLGHVQDVGLHSSNPAVRIYQTRERQTFHTDSCDIVGLLCLQTARSGGHSALVSSESIFNAMRARRPDLAQLLFQPLATDRRGEMADGQAPFFTIPVFNWWPVGPGGRLSVIYQRQYLDSAQRFAEAPRITPQIREALDLFDALANDPALHFMMELQVGDVQLVHNHNLLHDRTGFEDWPEPERRRHLLRLWLSAPAGRALPPVFAQRYGNVLPGERGGVQVPRSAWHAPLQAK